MLLRRDHRVSSPGTRDGSARAVEGARRFPGHRPCNATRPPGTRSAPNPSSCPRAVWRGRPRAGKSDPSRAPGTRAGDRDDRDGLRDSDDAVGARPGPMRDVRRYDTSTSNTHGRDHTRRRSQRGRCSDGRPSGEAARPRRRRGGALRLDTAFKPWHNGDDWLGPAKHRGGHRGSGDLTSRPSSRPTAGPSAYQQPSTDFEGALGGSCSRASV